MSAHLMMHARQEEDRRNREREEEMNMTNYTAQELQDDWEFKSLRSNNGVFRKAEYLNAIVQEEALAGWQLLEKLDDDRVRFKRHTSAKRKDSMLPQGYDPYRTQVGRGNNAAIAATVGGLVALLIGGMVVFMQNDAAVSANDWMIMAVTGIFLVVALVVKTMRRYR